MCPTRCCYRSNNGLITNMADLNKELCKICGSFMHYQTFCPQKRRPFMKQRKPIPKTGRRYDQWATFRDEVAKPYLNEMRGNQCSCCGRSGLLDIDHIKPRGSHPELKYELTNLQYLCRTCHRRKTDKLDCFH